METNAKAYSSTWVTTPTSIYSFSRPSRELGLPFRNAVTDFDQRVIKQILIDGDEELKKCEMELNRLNAAIIGVQSRRAGIQREMESYQALLSPVQKMPTEILTEIFMLCARDIENSDGMGDIMMISMVCGRWRELAFSVPALWSHIDMSIGHSPKDDGHYHRLRRYVETFLERSRNSQLTLNLAWEAVHSFDSDMSVDEESVASIFGALRMNSDRVRVFYFNVLAFIRYEPILRRLMTSYSSLEHLDFSFFYCGEDEELADISFFDSATALRSFSYRSHVGWKMKSHFPWHQLHRLVIQDAYARKLLPILAMCNNLRHLELSDVDDDLEEGTHSGHILLPNLQLLAVSAADEALFSSALGHLTVPKLESFKIRGLGGRLNSEEKFWTLASVRDLLTRSRCSITSLELHHVVLSEYDTISLFDATPELRFVKIVEAIAFDHREGRPRPLEGRRNHIVTPSFLRHLTSEFRARTASSSFLSKLKNLTLFVHRNDLDETSLLHAIASRWSGRGQTGYTPNTTSGTYSCSEFLRSVEVRLLTFEEGSSSLGDLPMLGCFKDAGLRITLGECNCYGLLRLLGKSLLD
ncbi:hypothetical protein AAF712_000293 [Marasmius tenuissimus]|uniref:F-box domain-containing protein n=1 Tax=Marasmius tenuissimus TaxID=585030 RepID=A0ABR3AG52_9AGAR|nr:hypothetical protein PM082_001080 [Marasmius tenuissimus]